MKIYNLIVYILRYFSIISTKYKVSKKINFGSTFSNKFFLRNLRKSKFYLEYGSGSSTLLAKSLNKDFISLELDKSFYNYLKSKIKINQLKYFNIGPTKYFSFPILPYFLIKNKINIYCNFIKNISLEKKVIPDLILIDGRFRIYVCLCIIKFLLIKKINKKITIIIDDYKDRENYKVLRKVLFIKEIGRFGVIQYSSFKHINIKTLNKLMKLSNKDYL